MDIAILSVIVSVVIISVAFIALSVYQRFSFLNTENAMSIFSDRVKEEITYYARKFHGDITFTEDIGGRIRVLSADNLSPLKLKVVKYMAMINCFLWPAKPRKSHMVDNINITEIDSFSTNYSVRMYRHKDAEAIKNIIKETADVTKFDVANFNKIINQRSRVYVAEDKHGDIVGFATFNPDTIGYDLSLIAVSKPHRKFGIAKMLISTMNDKKISLFVSTENTNAINFYNKYGFVKVKTIKNYYNDKSDAMVMTYNIRN